MFNHCFSTRNLVMGVVLAAILVSLLTLVVFGQTDPDKTNPTLEEELETGDRNGWKYMFIPASAFVPVDDNMDYAYWGTGCVYRLGGTYYSEYSLQLPEGAKIFLIEIFFYDDHCEDVSAQLYAFNGFEGHTLIAGVSSSGAAPMHNNLYSSLFTHVVENSHDALTLRLTYPADNADLRICGVKVYYEHEYSFFGSFLPLVTK